MNLKNEQFEEGNSIQKLRNYQAFKNDKYFHYHFIYKIFVFKILIFRFIIKNEFFIKDNFNYCIFVDLKLNIKNKNEKT